MKYNNYKCIINGGINNFKDIINVNRNAYNQLASEFSSRESDLANYKQNLKAYISRFVKESESVLEIGPGTGHLLQILENLGCRTTAIELSGKMCELVKKIHPKQLYSIRTYLQLTFVHNSLTLFVH